jgi:hypothetical protein
LKSITSLADDCGAKYRIVFLGDIIDRERQNREAMELVAETLANVPGRASSWEITTGFPFAFWTNSSTIKSTWPWNTGAGTSVATRPLGHMISIPPFSA